MAADGAEARRAWRVTGRVQGVGFRWHTVRTARELGITGRVWNRPDGSVEVHARGPVDDLARLGSWLAKGPPAARVGGIEEIEPGPAASEAGFHAIV